MVEIDIYQAAHPHDACVSVLYREPMWLKCYWIRQHYRLPLVSVLYREPMWLKSGSVSAIPVAVHRFQCSTVSRCG